jgi:HlyD family secretion protein
MKKSILLLIVIAIIGAILTVAGCGKNSGASSKTQTQTYTVQKGTLLSTVSAVGDVSMPEQVKLTFGTGSSTSSLYTVQEINVSFGDTVKKGDVLAKIDTSSLESTIAQDKVALSTAQKNLQDTSSEATKLNAQAAVNSAEAILATAEQALEDLQNSQVTDAQTAVSDAQSALDRANRALAIAQTTAANNITNAGNNITNQENDVTKAQNDVTDAENTYNEHIPGDIGSYANLLDYINYRDKLALQVKEAKDALQQAEDSLQQAEDNLDKVKLQNETDIATAQNNVTKAEATLQSAEDDLAAIESDNPDMLKQEAAVATAKANLITAQDDLAYIEAGSNTELLQIKVDNAQTTLDNDNAQLEAATIVAPYDGVVAAVYYDVGAKVSATNDIIYLVNTSKVEISSSVDEIDVAKVKAGQTAIVTFDAIEGARLNGTVGAISPVAASSSNVVTYSFSISIQDTRGYDLKEGMTAAADIVVLNKSDVLLVPSSAITQSGRNSVVQVVNSDGTTEQRTIQTGETNGTQTEVTSGLSEGEKILVQTSTSSSTSSSSSSSRERFFIGPGGGF